MNKFENWASLPDQNFETQLLKRAFEIGNMFEGQLEQVTTNTRKAQDKQVAIQNKAHNIQIEKLDIGQCVC